MYTHLIDHNYDWLADKTVYGFTQSLTVLSKKVVDCCVICSIFSSQVFAMWYIYD